MSRIRATLRHLSPTCRQATKLASRRLDGPLAPTERFGLVAHLALCTSCRRFSHQMELLQQLLRNFDDGACTSDLPRLPPASRVRIEQVLRNTSVHPTAEGEETSH